MTVNVTSPVTGAAQTGFTSPTYTLIADRFPGNNGNQWYISALGGTQTGASAQSADKPFTLSFERPNQIKLTTVNSQGVVISAGRNKYALFTRKGMPAVSGQPAQLAWIRSEISVPSGAETVSPAEIRAMLSLHLGALAQVSAGAGDSVIAGTL